MIIEALLSAQLAAAQPAPTFAATTYRSSSISRSYSPTRTRLSSSAPKRIRSTATPSNVIRVPSARSTPKPAAQQKVLRSSSGNIVVNKQKSPPPVSTPKSSTTLAPSTRYNAPAIPSPQREIVRERYVERDGDIFSNPFFWMWMSESSQNSRAPVVVQSAPSAVADPSGSVTTQPSQAPIATQPAGNRFLENVAVFLLGGGIVFLLLLFFNS